MKFLSDCFGEKSSVVVEHFNGAFISAVKQNRSFIVSIILVVDKIFLGEKRIVRIKRKMVYFLLEEMCSLASTQA